MKSQALKDSADRLTAALKSAQDLIGSRFSVQAFVPLPGGRELHSERDGLFVMGPWDDGQTPSATRLAETSISDRVDAAWAIPALWQALLDAEIRRTGEALEAAGVLEVFLTGKIDP
jgi:hypothetical protein